MKRIRILEERVINHIAAGEIIERPAAVVKELVENSIDANASNITVVVEKGGKKSIEVIDNGSGMTRDDALLSFERHSTSKIYKIEDINDISTLGFRGEALPSIAQICSLEIITLPQNAKNKPATKIQISYGKIYNVTQTASNPGTRLKVKNIFKKVPARKKFLKTDRTELRHIINLLQNIACINPEIAFHLNHNGREIFNYPEVNLLEKRITQIFGDDFFISNIIPLQEKGQHTEILGFIGSFYEETLSRPIHKVFINKRAINDKIVYSAIKKAYEPFTKKLLYKNETPLYIIFLDVQNDKIDFNVSPTKNEVRFINPNFIFNFVKKSITEALLRYEKKKLSENTSITPSEHELSKPDFETTKTSRGVSSLTKKGKRKFSTYKSGIDELFMKKQADQTNNQKQKDSSTCFFF